MKSILFGFIFGSISLFENNYQNKYPINFETISKQIEIVSNTPLSKEIITFESSIFNNNKIKLDWSTISEITTEVFVIQNSKDGETFIDITIVVPNGDNTKYDFIDIFPNSGKNYYRLKIMRYDEKFEYSKTITIFNHL
jgi:uncharacterized membrane protein